VRKAPAAIRVAAFIRNQILRRRAKPPAAVGVVVFIYACFGMAASAIHANTAAGSFALRLKDIFV